MHDCSICGCACYCHGDIDDCQVETVDYSYMHCDGCGCSDDPDDGFLDERDDWIIPPDNLSSCLFPSSCCMPGEHSPDECHTPEMLEAAYEEARIPKRWPAP